MKVGILVSGDLGFKALVHVVEKHHVVFVMTNKGSDDIIAFCHDMNFNLFIGNPRCSEVDNFIVNQEIEVLLSVNYLFLIDQNLIELPSLLSFNIHGSLLPKFRGRTPHVWSIINNEKYTGATAHLISKECDEGDVIVQKKFKILEMDTGGDLLVKFEPLYLEIIDEVLYKAEHNRLTFKVQDSSKATFFGKRTPEDGQISWDWSKERIRNWVRAQALPYPGAFSYYNGKKVIIDEITWSDYGFNFDKKNGTILSVNPLIIKVTNGAVELTKIRLNQHIFVVNEILI